MGLNSLLSTYSFMEETVFSCCMYYFSIGFESVLFLRFAFFFHSRQQYFAVVRTKGILWKLARENNEQTNREMKRERERGRENRRREKKNKREIVDDEWFSVWLWWLRWRKRLHIVAMRLRMLHQIMAFVLFWPIQRCSPFFLLFPVVQSRHHHYRDFSYWSRIASSKMTITFYIYECEFRIDTAASITMHAALCPIRLCGILQNIFYYLGACDHFCERTTFFFVFLVSWLFYYCCCYLQSFFFLLAYFDNWSSQYR